MAEDKDESQEKTQDPSSRRIEKAREDGKVVTSKEMMVFTVLAVGVILMYLIPPLLEDFLKITKSFFSFGPELQSGRSPLQSIKEVINFFKSNHNFLNSINDSSYSYSIFSWWWN